MHIHDEFPTSGRGCFHGSTGGSLGGAVSQSHSGRGGRPVELCHFFAVNYITFLQNMMVANRLLGINGMNHQNSQHIMPFKARFDATQIRVTNSKSRISQGKNNSQLQPNSNLSLPPAPTESLHGPPWNSGPPNMRHRKSLLPSILRAPGQQSPGQRNPLDSMDSYNKNLWKHCCWLVVEPPI